tara:strand:- start:1784 stop:2524 length:741 start_codon:yes stop_codon:yes gene_type:complete
MSIFDTMEKRHHVYEYHEKNIPDEIVKDLLWKAWKISPSKHNFMPYKISVLGPNKQREKSMIWKKSQWNHKRMEAAGANLPRDDLSNNPYNEKPEEYTFHTNPAYNHVKHNSHLLIFSARICKPNGYMKHVIKKEGHYAEECEKSEVTNLRVASSFQASLFACHLTALCIEQGIDVSYNLCLPGEKEAWDKMPYLWYDKEQKHARVFANMSLGYGKYFRHQWLKDVKTDIGHMDLKPEIDEVIEWV